jgi:hypothetical protein
MESSSLVDRAKNAASSAVDATREAASTVVEKTKDFAANVAGTMEDAASTVGQQARRATQAVSDTVESGAHYVQERGVRGMVDDLTGQIRQHPLPALAVGFCFGLLLSRLMRD